MKSVIDGGRPLPALEANFFRLLSVSSGFCSDPERMNSLPAIAESRMNHEWSCPASRIASTEAVVWKPGNRGTGMRSPLPSSHSVDGPGMMRIACEGQTGAKLDTPSV